MQERDIYLAGGCFWGVEKYLSLVPGVLNTRAGYANSKIPNPSYQQVCSGDSGAVETVHCLYDQAVLRLDELLFMYFDIIDPTSIDRQANDIGSQYRTGIYYTEASDADVVQACLFELAIRYQQPIVVENQMLGSFYAAEDYHQSYLDKNPQGYCHLPIDMFLQVDRRLARQVAVRNLNQLSWAVTQKAATEPPFNNRYDQHFEPGIYVDIISGEPLFSSIDKYDHGCGWPAFTRPISLGLLDQQKDYQLGYERTEVISASSQAHLGHVFSDGPIKRGGQRYCINSAALRFVALAEMEAAGYGSLVDQFDLDEGGSQ